MKIQFIEIYKRCDDGINLTVRNVGDVVETFPENLCVDLNKRGIAKKVEKKDQSKTTAKESKPVKPTEKKPATPKEKKTKK